MLIIGILGKKGAGKDTVAKILKSSGFYDVKFAGNLKTACKNIFSFTEEQVNGSEKETIDDFWKVTPREIMQFFGTDLMRDQIGVVVPGIDKNIWVKCIERQIINLQKTSGTDNFTVSDVRFENEVDFIHRMGGLIIKIDRTSRDGTSRDGTRPDDNRNGNHNESNTGFTGHSSENEMQNITNYDYLVINDGTIEDLQSKIDKLYEEIMKKYK